MPDTGRKLSNDHPPILPRRNEAFHQAGFARTLLVEPGKRDVQNPGTNRIAAGSFRVPLQGL